MQKQSVWIIWIGSIVAMTLGSGWVATAGMWTFGLTFLAHTAEFIMNLSLFKQAEGTMVHHFVQTMIYGLFHWMPIKKSLESGAES